MDKIYLEGLSWLMLSGTVIFFLRKFLSQDPHKLQFLCLCRNFYNNKNLSYNCTLPINSLSNFSLPDCPWSAEYLRKFVIRDTNWINSAGLSLPDSSWSAEQLFRRHQHSSLSGFHDIEDWRKFVTSAA